MPHPVHHRCADQGFISLPMPAGGQQELRCRLNRTASLEHATITVTLLLSPTTTVQCTLSSLDGTEGIVRPGIVSFEAGQKRFVAEAVVVGLLDIDDDGPKVFRVVARCVSGDTRFDGAEAFAVVTNQDVPLPRVVSMHPSVSPYIATQVSFCHALEVKGSRRPCTLYR